MPEVTVSMPAYNNEHYILEAVQSVLEQEQVDFELYIIDDCSTDNTYNIACSVTDKRVTVLRNTENKGISYCHNQVIELCNSAYIIHMDSDDIVSEPTAFRKMIDRISESANIGQAHCYFYKVDSNGYASAESMEKAFKSSLYFKPSNMDYRRDLVVKGSVMNGLRTYRSEIFKEIGNFNENMKIGEDIEMAMRILDKYEIKLVPELLFAVRIHDNNITSDTQDNAVKSHNLRTSIARRLLRENKARYFKQSKYNINKLYILGLIRALKLRKYFLTSKKFIKKILNIKNKVL